MFMNEATKVATCIGNRYQLAVVSGFKEDGYWLEYLKHDSWTFELRTFTCKNLWMSYVL